MTTTAKKKAKSASQRKAKREPIKRATAGKRATSTKRAAGTARRAPTKKSKKTARRAVRRSAR
jgi:hypothetical protein